MLNRIALQGRLVRDPEIRYTQNNIPVASFTLAVQRNYSGKNEKPVADFIPCVAWQTNANFAQDHLHKGMMILVEGELQSRKWTDKNGNNRTAYEVVVSPFGFNFCEPRREEKPPLPEEPAYMTQQSAVPNVDAEDDFTEVPGEVPF